MSRIGKLPIHIPAVLKMVSIVLLEIKLKFFSKLEINLCFKDKLKF